MDESQVIVQLIVFILWALYLVSLWPVILLLGMKPQFIGWSILLFQIGLIFVIKLQLLTWNLHKLLIALLCINILIAIAELALVAKSINNYTETLQNNKTISTDKEQL